MENIVRVIRQSSNSLVGQKSFAALKETIQPHILQLQNFQFYFSNPVFGLIILLVLFMLSRTWGIKKAFSYCLVVSTILYLTTKIAIYVNAPIKETGLAYADIIRGISFFIIALISIYYFFIKNE